MKLIRVHHDVQNRLPFCFQKNKFLEIAKIENYPREKDNISFKHGLAIFQVIGQN